jgi:hypothetical protein
VCIALGMGPAGTQATTAPAALLRASVGVEGVAAVGNVLTCTACGDGTCRRLPLGGRVGGRVVATRQTQAALMSCAVAVWLPTARQSPLPLPLPPNPCVHFVVTPVGLSGVSADGGSVAGGGGGVGIVLGGDVSPSVQDCTVSVAHFVAAGNIAGA